MKQTIGLVAGILLIAAATWVAWWAIYTVNEADIDSQNPQTIADKQDEASHHTAVESSWFVSGDTFWARRIQQAADASPLGEQFPFDRLDEFDIGPDNNRFDLRVTNLECPVTDTDVPLEAQENILQFNCRPSYLDEFNQYFDLVSLANNHTDNVDGAAGLAETRTKLEQAGIQHFGHYDNAVTDELCSVIDVPFRYLPEDTPRETNAAFLPIAFCGFHGVFKLPLDEEIAEISKYSAKYLTIAMPHMGEEYVPVPDEIKTTTYRKMIDAGADVVIGGHPHWVQSTEVYNGVPIFYSLGNFLFDQEWSVDVARGAALEINITAKSSPELTEYLIAAKCRVGDANCDGTENIDASDEIVKPNFKLSFNPVFSEFKAGQTFPASEQTSAELLERMNWAETEAILNSL